MRILVIGGTGLLGIELVRELSTQHEVVAPSRQDFDVTDPVSVGRLIDGEFGKFDWIINASGYTNVELAETERDEALTMNALFPGLLATAALLIHAEFLHFSTDFIFDGQQDEPYTEDSETNPLNVYGETKRKGEEMVLASNPFARIMRTAWLYGPAATCFPYKILTAWRAGKPLRVVTDQSGSPTSTLALARLVSEAIEKQLPPGIYHAAGPDPRTWYDFAQQTLVSASEINGWQDSIEIEPAFARDWPSAVKRPPNSVLDSSKLVRQGMAPMPALEASLREYLEKILPEIN